MKKPQGRFTAWESGARYHALGFEPVPTQMLDSDCLDDEALGLVTV